MVIFEKFDANQQYASANKVKVGDTIYVREECADQQLAEKDKEIADLKEWVDWYKMWHDKFKKQIEDLTTELETYRPTRLKGEGQTKCSKCGDLSWTDFGYSKYKGQILCDKCLEEVLKGKDLCEKQK